MSSELSDLFDVEGTEAAEAAPPELAVVEPAAPVEPVEAAEATQEPAEPVAAETEVDAPVEGVEPAEGVTEAPLYMGKYKSAEAMAEAFAEYQSHADRKLAEEQAKNEAYEHMATLEAQQQQAMMQMEHQAAAQQQQQVSPEDLAAGVEQAPIDTYKWAVQNSPDQVPGIIAAVAEKHGQKTAMELQTNWTQVQLYAQQQQMQEAMQAQYQEIMAPQMIRQSVEEGLAMVEQEYGEDFNALRAEIGENLAKMGKLPSYDKNTVAAAVQMSFLAAHRERALKAVSSAPVARTPSPGESVETGTPGNAPELSEEETIFSQIVDLNKG